MERLIKFVEKFLENHRFVRRWRKIIAVLTALAVFITTYSMILPAISLETDQGPEIGLFADTSGEESVPDGSTVTDSIPEAGAQGDVLTPETASLPAETESVSEELSTETLPEENAPAESTPAEITPTETVSEEAAPAATETPAPKVEELSAVPEEPAYLENEKLVFENNSIKLTLTVPAAAKVVKGAAIDVREIGQPFANDGLDENGRKNEYLSYLAAAETALNLTAEEVAYIEKNIVNTPAAELPWARFFAISIKNADGAIAPACALPVEIIYKNTAETAADGLKVMCLFPNGTMTMIGSETKVATAAQTPIALLSAADSNFDITSKFTDAGTLTFGTFAVQISEIDAAIEKEKAAKAAAEAAKAESASGTESVPAEASVAPAAESAGPAVESSATETAESSAAESVPAEDASVFESAEDEAAAPTEDESAAQSAEESLPAEAEDESLAEEAEKTEEKTETQEQPKADDKVTKTLITKGSDYTVTMTYTADAKIPAGVILSAKEILPTAYNYKGYFNKAADALNLSDEQKSNTYARFFDIKILLGNSEVTPAAPVQVEITYNKPQEKSANAEMNAVHFGKEGPEVIAAEATQANAATGEVNAVGFEAGSFSVYGVMYTVDFETADGGVYSISGGSIVSLAGLLDQMGYNVADEQIENAEFSDASLVNVYENAEDLTIERIAAADDRSDMPMTAIPINKDLNYVGVYEDVYTTETVKAGSWVLESKAPFTTEELLKVYLTTGEILQIKVTDAQNSDGTWHLVDNTVTFNVSTLSETSNISHSASIDADFSFTLMQSALQEMKALAATGENPVLYYDFNSALYKDGVKIANVDNVSRGSLRVGNREVGYYSINDGVLTMTITARSWLIGRTTLSGQFGFSASLDADNTKNDDEETFEFPGAGDIDVTFRKKTEEGDKELNGVKNADGSWTLYYAATLQVNDPLDSLAFTDTYSGEQTLDSGSVQVNGRAVNISPTGTGFTISNTDFRSAINRPDGQIPAGTYRITYSTTVAAEDLLKEEILDGDPTSTIERNVASWTVDGDANHPGGSTEKEIPFETPEPPTTPFGKSSTPATGTTLSNAGETITYVIEVGDAETSLNGLQVKDTMTDLQTLNDGKVYIAYGDPNGTRTEMPAGSITWTNDDNYSSNMGQVFDYTFTTNQNGPAYIIYSTTTITQEKATEKGIYGNQTVQNNATLVNDNKWAGTQHPIPFKEQTKVPVTKGASVSDGDLTADSNWKPGAVVTYTLTIGTKDGDEPTNLNNMHVYDTMQDLQALNAGSISMVIRHPDGSTSAVTNVVKDGNTVPVSQTVNSAASDSSYSTNWVNAFDFNLPSNVGEGELVITYTTTIMDQDSATALGIFGNVSVGNTGHGGNGSNGTTGTVGYEPEPEMGVEKLVDGVEAKTLDSIETEENRTVTYTVTYGYDEIKKMDGVVISDEMTDIQKLVTDEEANADITIEVMNRPEADLVDASGNVVLSLSDWDAGTHTFKMPKATAQWNQDGYSWTYFDDDSYNAGQYVRVFHYTLPNGLGVNQIKVTFQAQMISQEEANDNAIAGAQHAKNKAGAGNKSDETDVTVPYEEEVTHKGDIEKRFLEWDAENNRAFWTIRVFKREGSAYPLTDVTVSENRESFNGQNSEGEQLAIGEMSFQTKLYDWQNPDLYLSGSSIDLSIVDVAHAVVVTDSGTTLVPGEDYSIDKANASFHFDTLEEGITITLPVNNPLHQTTHQQVNLINTFEEHNVVKLVTEENWDYDHDTAVYHEEEILASKTSKYDAEKKIITYEVHLNRAQLSQLTDADVIFSDTLEEGLTLLNWDTEEAENPTILFQVQEGQRPMINNQSNHDGVGSIASADVAFVDQMIQPINLSEWCRNNEMAGRPDLKINGHHFVIYYKASVASDWDEVTSSETGYKDYDNTVTFKAGDKDYTGHTVTRVSSNEEIEKYDTTPKQDGFVVDSEGNRSNEITYRVDVNKDRVRLNTAGRPYIQLTDRIDTNMDLNTGSVKVVRVNEEDGSYTDITDDLSISYNDNTRILSIEQIPDRQYVILTFSAYARAQGTDTYNNTATVIGGGSHSASVSEEHSISTSYAGLGGDNLLMNLNKINQNKITEKVPGAEFKLYEIVWEEDPLANGFALLNRLMEDWKEANYFDKAGKDYSYIREAFKIQSLTPIIAGTVESQHGKGQVYVTDEQGYIDWSENLSDFHVYMWEEVYAPAGYTGILNDPHYFIVYPEKNAEAGIYSQTNFPWADSGEYIAQSIAWAVDNATQMANQNEDGSDIIVASLATGTTWTATNISSDKTYIEGTKKWEADSDDLFDTRPENGITLQLWRMKEDGSGKEMIGNPIPINADPETGEWPSYMWNNLDRFYQEESEGVQVAKLWKYYIVEEDVPGYTTTYSDGGEGVNEGEIIITNKLIPSNVDISVKKAFDPDGDNKPSQIIVELWRINTPVGGEAEEAEYTGITTALTALNDWQATFEKLPTHSENGTYTYTVKERQTAEVAAFNYTVTYSDNGEGVFDTEDAPLTITNSLTGSLKVAKELDGMTYEQLTEEQKEVLGKITFTVTDESETEIASFCLKVDEDNMDVDLTKTIDNLKPGIYTVTEAIPNDGTPEGYVYKTTTVTVDGTGTPNDEEKSSTATVEGNETVTVTFVNEYEELTDFTFYKVWHNTSSQITAWGDVTSITVTVGREAEGVVDSGFSYTYEAEKTAFTEAGTEISEKDSKEGAPILKAILVPAVAPATVPQYKFCMENLAKRDESDAEYQYFVRETQVSGYNEPNYGQSQSKGAAYNNGEIINKPYDSVELPDTGGQGTLLLYTLGAILVLGGGILLAVRRRMEV